MDIRANIKTADFRHNFDAAQAFNDTGLQSDLLLNQIAELISAQPLSVITAMRQAGYKFTGTTQQDLVRAVADLLTNNLKFRAVIASLIAVKTNVVSYDEVSQIGEAISEQQPLSDTGQVKQYNVAGLLVGPIMEGIGNIFNGIGNMVSSSNALKQQKEANKANIEMTKINADASQNISVEQTKQALLNALAAKQLSLAQNNSGAGNAGTLILVIVILAAIGGGGYWLYNNYFKTQPQALS